MTQPAQSNRALIVARDADEAVLLGTVIDFDLAYLTYYGDPTITSETFTFETFTDAIVFNVTPDDFEDQADLSAAKAWLDEHVTSKVAQVRWL